MWLELRGAEVPGVNTSSSTRQQQRNNPVKRLIPSPLLPGLGVPAGPWAHWEGAWDEVPAWVLAW